MSGLRSRVRDEALYFLFGFVSYRLYAIHAPGLSGPLTNQLLRFRPAALIGKRSQQFRRDENPVRTVQRGHQHDACPFRLIVEHDAWRRKDENQNEPDDNVVLPGGARKIPKNKTS